LGKSILYAESSGAHAIHSKVCIIWQQASIYGDRMASNRPDSVAQKMVSKLIETRKEKGISMNKLAWMAGISPSAIAFLENGTHSPTLKTFLRIAAAMEMDVARLYWEAEQAVPAE
jgi:DNA-binding XRE family transcriptional regulator